MSCLNTFSNGKHIEHKGKKSGKRYIMTGGDKLEFLTDVVYYLRHDQQFEWVIPPRSSSHRENTAKNEKIAGCGWQYG